MPQTRVGISGWTYAPWRGAFYPPTLPQRRELEFASRAFNAIEINGTFYSMQKPASWATWARETPDDFVFAVKGGKFITHSRRLKDCRGPLANFFAQGLLTLGAKLGPILWQLPPTLPFDAERIDAFLALLPRDAQAAAALAAEHDRWMKGKADFRVDANRPIRHAIEARHASFDDPSFAKLLRQHRVAVVVADTAGRQPLIEEVTADFVYCRLHGDETLYANGYSDDALDAWAAKIKAWSRRRRDVFAFFDDDVKVHSPFDASALAHRLRLNDAPLRPLADLDAIDAAIGRAMPKPSGGRKPTAKARSMSVGHVPSPAPVSKSLATNKKSRRVVKPR